MVNKSVDRLRGYLSNVENQRIDHMVEALEKRCEASGEDYHPSFSYRLRGNQAEVFETVAELLEAKPDASIPEIMISCCVTKADLYSHEEHQFPLTGFELSLHLKRDLQDFQARNPKPIAEMETNADTTSLELFFTYLDEKAYAQAKSTIEKLEKEFLSRNTETHANPEPSIQYTLPKREKQYKTLEDLFRDNPSVTNGDIALSFGFIETDGMHIELFTRGLFYFALNSETYKRIRNITEDHITGNAPSELSISDDIHAVDSASGKGDTHS